MTSLLLRLSAISATLLIAATQLTGCAQHAHDVATRGKLHSIGFIWLKNPGNPNDRQKLIAAAHSFARQIPEVQGLSVGQPQNLDSKFADPTFDVALSMYFDNAAALQRYSDNPIHQQAAQQAFLPLARKIQFYHFRSE